MRKLFLFSLLAAQNPAGAQPPAPADFAYAQAVVPTRDAAADTKETAAAYRFALPMTVYQNTVHEDLRDLRIFNGDGAVVPYALSRPAAQSAAATTNVDVPLFPLHDGARVSIDGVRVTINAAASIVNLQTQNGAPSDDVVRQYLLDARGVDASLSRLTLSWPDTASDYTGRLSIEISEDLAAWRFLSVVPIANLHANAQSLIENHVDLPATKARFWRLTWLGLPPNFAVDAVQAQLSINPIEPARSTLDVGGILDSQNPREVLFDLGAQVPVSRVNMLLPDQNSVLNVELSSRATPTSAWRTVLDAGVYRIKTDDGEQQNAALPVLPDNDRYWRARISGDGTAPRSPPRLHVEWIPNEVTFLAQGHAPFLLAYGNASATRGEADLRQLPRALKVADASLGPVQVTGGTSRLIPKSAPFPAMRALLWSVLILAVLLLGWMAYRIASEPNETK